MNIIIKIVNNNKNEIYKTQNIRETKYIFDILHYILKMVGISFSFIGTGGVVSF